MSLSVDDDRRRTRSRSRDRRSRDDPPRENPAFSDVREPSYVYPEDDLDDRYRSRRDERPAAPGSGLPYPAEGGFDSVIPDGRPLYSYDSQRPAYRTASPVGDKPYRSSRDRVADQPPGAFPGDEDPNPRESKSERKERKARDRDRDDRESRPSRYPDPRPDERALDEDKLNYLPQKYSLSSNKEGRRRDKHDGRGSDEEKLRYLPSKYSARYDDRESEYRDTPDRRDRRDRHSRDHRPDDDEERLKHLPQKYSNRYNADAGDGYPERERDGDERLKYLPQKYNSSRYNDGDEHRHSDREREKEDRRRSRKEARELEDEDLAYGSAPTPGPEANPNETYGSYLSGSTWEDRRSPAFDDQDPRRRRASPSLGDPGVRRSQLDPPMDDPRDPRPRALAVDSTYREPDDPSDRRRRRDKSPRPDMLTVETGGRDRSKSRERSRSRDRRSGSHRDKSPQPPTARMSSLTVDSGRPSNLSLAAAPASPLLESYHGTYQDCSPMPSPLLLASGNPNEDLKALDSLSPIASDNEPDGKKRTRRARFHDPEDIATRLAAALRGDGPPDKEPLVEILPSLTHEQVMELRADYKAIVKTGSSRKGVNIAKHIRARLKDENPNLMKACYAVALGRWESEAYWANYWYQGDKTRRELLIESLMGRTNDEIRQIKKAFTDKRYDNSLTRCMRTELKEDKFKKAVLMVLDERRMDEYDAYGAPLPIDYRLVDQDVDDLYRAVKSDKGGESLMISIIVQRSDSHLREILREYERAFRSNFARDSLKKSGNLVVSRPPSPVAAAAAATIEMAPQECRNRYG